MICRFNLPDILMVLNFSVFLLVNKFSVFDAIQCCWLCRLGSDSFIVMNVGFAGKQADYVMCKSISHLPWFNFSFPDECLMLIEFWFSESTVTTSFKVRSVVCKLLTLLGFWYSVLLTLVYWGNCFYFFNISYITYIFLYINRVITS